MLNADDHGRLTSLWAAVLFQTVTEFWEEHRNALSGQGKPEYVIERARRYFESRDGETVMERANIEPCESAVAAMLAAVSAPVSPLTAARLLNDKDRACD